MPTTLYDTFYFGIVGYVVEIFPVKIYFTVFCVGNRIEDVYFNMN